VSTNVIDGRSFIVTFVLTFNLAEQNDAAAEGIKSGVLHPPHTCNVLSTYKLNGVILNALLM
jgi:hypothetical protein